MTTLSRIADRLWTARLLVGLWLLVNILDVVLTQVVLASGWKELNPLLSGLSSSNMWVYKLVVTGVVAILLAAFNKVSYLRWATLGIALVVIWYTVNLTFAMVG